MTSLVFPTSIVLVIYYVFPITFIVEKIIIYLIIESPEYNGRWRKSPSRIVTNVSVHNLYLVLLSVRH